jgi:serine/threonine protein kinase
MQSLPSCTDYTTSVVNNLVKAPMLNMGQPEMYKDRPVKYTGGFCIVFPYMANGKKYAVRCWHAYLEGAEDRTRIIAKALHQINLPYFVGFEYINNGVITPQGPQPIVVMDWVNAKPLKKYIAEHLRDSSCLNALANTFAGMVKDLHAHNISHGDLQHGNIMVKDDGSLVLVDYDSMYVPELQGWTDEISGLAGYQHPGRWNNKKLTPKADFFSELVIYTSLKALAELPDLWSDLNIEDTDTMLFSAEDIKSGGTTPIFTILESTSSCQNLCAKIKDFLSRESIEDLEPLEKAIVSDIDRLSGQWKNNGYQTSSAYEKDEISQISDKW